MRLFRWLAVTAAAVAVLIAAAVIYVATLDLNTYKAEIQAKLEEATGRRVEIDGPLHLTWSPWLGLAASGVRVANAEWGSEPAMATVGEIAVGVEMMPLLSGDLVVRRLSLADVRLLLERDGEGRENWDLGGSPGGGASGGDGELPAIGHIDLARVTVAWKDGPKAPERIYHVERLSLDGEGLSAPLDVTLVADLDGEPLDLKGTLPPPAELRRPGAVLPVDVEGSLGGVAIALAGEFQVEQGAGNEVRLARIDGIKASYGEFSAAGVASLDLTGPRPRIEARLETGTVDLDRLGGDGAGGDGAGGGDPLDRTFPTELLSIVDGSVEIKVASLVSGAWTVDEVSATVKIKDGVLTVDPIQGRVADGSVGGRLELDARKQPTRVALAGTASGVDVGAISRKLRGDALIEGRAKASLELRGRGETPRAILGSADGISRLVISDGTIMNKYWELIAQDLATRFIPFVGEGGGGRLNCLVSRFDITGGAAESTILLVDGERVTVAGEGRIGLARGTLEMRLVPQPKDPSLLSLATPILLTGTVFDPKPAPDPVGVAMGVGGLAAGAVVGPLGLLLPFLSAGSIDKPCPAAIAAAEGARRPAAGRPTGEQDKPGGIKGLFDGLRKSIE